MLEGRGQKIMVVDNDRTVLELLQIRLEVLGYRAYIHRKGHSALEMVGQVRPAAMIVDTLVGDGDGFDIVSAIRGRNPDQHFPILMTGRNLTVEDIRRAQACGAQSCIAKPFSGADVVERIGRLLQAAHRPPPEIGRPVAYV